MELQTDLLFPAEIPFFVRNEMWRRSQTVLDLGTGNGYYLRRMARVYPDKSYIGVDVDDYYIKQAKIAEHEPLDLSEPIKYQLSNIFDVTGDFDAIIARLLIQHLDSLEAFSDLLKRILDKEGSVYVIESCDEDRAFLPDMPNLRNFFSAFRENREQAGFSRDNGQLLSTRCRDLGLTEVNSQIVTTSSLFDITKELFFETYMTVSEIVRLNFHLDVDQDALKRELRDWCSMDGGYTHLSVRINQYRC